MWFRSAFDSLLSRNPRGIAPRPSRQRSRRRAASARLLLEALEDRTVPSFLTPVDHAAGGSPTAIVTADLRNDGIQDLVMTSAGTVSVLLGNGDGTFQPPRSYATGTGSVAVAVGDFNGDGKLDLATANDGTSQSAPGTVSVLLGNGDGTFRAPINLTLPAERPPGSNYTGTTPLPQQPRAIAVGDMNHDGSLDLVVTAETTYETYWLYGSDFYQNAYADVLVGHGDGTFALASTTLFDSWSGQGGMLPLNYGWTQSLALGDFNGDGNLDIATLGVINPDNLVIVFTPPSPDSVFLLRGNGDGTVQAPASIPTGQLPVSLAAGDLNGDGKIDLVTASYYSYGYAAFRRSGGVSVLLGNGDGTFQAAANLVLPTWSPPGYTGKDSLPLNQQANGLVLGDLTGDGKLDLAVTAASVYSVYAGTATNSYGTYKVYDTVAKSNVNVLLGHGDGHFTDTEIVPENGNYSYGRFPNFEPNPQAVTTGNFNSDALPDLAVAEYGATSASVLLNGGAWTATTMLDASGFPSPATAGVSGTFTVEAENGLLQPDTGYTGTVTFSTSDPKAMIVNPATGTLVSLNGFTYTFNSGDQGVHKFNVTLYTAGTQSITASDSRDSLSDSEKGITVNAAATKLIVSGFPSPTTAGAAGSFIVTLEDAYGNIAKTYAGTVRFMSSDPKAVLPANYTFTSADAGVHTFTATLKTAGTQSITATDTVTASFVGTDGNITVNPAAASQFIITAPACVNPGVPFSLTLKVEDAYGNIVTNYTGTVHFGSTDNKATLPTDYTFTAADKGVHTFTGLILRKKGKQTITITDTHNHLLAGSVIEDVI
jgi:hypothetical protein